MALQEVRIRVCSLCLPWQQEVYLGCCVHVCIHTCQIKSLVYNLSHKIRACSPWGMLARARKSSHSVWKHSHFPLPPFPLFLPGKGIENDTLEPEIILKWKLELKITAERRDLGL